jgi:hypothetical protein
MNTQKLLIYIGCAGLICLALYRFYDRSTIEGMSSKQEENMEKKFEEANKNLKSILGFIKDRVEPELEYINSSNSFQECIDNFRTVSEAAVQYHICQAFKNTWNSPGWKKSMADAETVKTDLDLINNYF